MWALLLVFLWSQDGTRVLIMNNGKKLVCSKVEDKGNVVQVVSNGQAYSFPKKLINWEASEQAQKQYESDLAEAEARKTAETQAQPKAEEERKPIVFVSIEEKPDSGQPTKVQLTKRGNSLIVPVVLNGKGPYSIILDTGAELTCISPVITREVGAQRVEGEVHLGGVGGTEQGKIVLFSEISVAGARVGDFHAVEVDLSKAMGEEVIGLLGQDFLNHFSVQINSSENFVEFTPISGRAVDHLGDRISLEALIDRWKDMSGKIGHHMGTVGRVTQNYQRGGTQRLGTDAQQAELFFIDLRSLMNELISEGGDKIMPYLSSAERLRFQQDMSCHPIMDRFLTDVVRYCHHFVSNPQPTDQLTQQFSDEYSQLQARYNEFEACQARY
ncbi:MAG: clan AA aspartic protease [Acidobacteria bacterium]|nr:clan AA aspartic protease [Acidobacteriota bacterium]MCB9398954.1 clan AA aspartic protease [Acidobacteriota bacterium]